MSEFFNDSPILEPSEDRFGVDPFARALARSIRQIKSPVGTTIALNGAWGSGKSSVVNLITHHLNTSADDDLVIVDFKCWWFRGEEALTLAFLQTLNGALQRGLGAQAKQLLGKIGKKLLQAGPVLGPALNLVSGGTWSAIAAVLSGSLDFSKQFFSDGESVEDLFERLSALLAAQSKRFLVVVDDIDRLAPEEAILIFRLLKSVGRLPNVIYLVIFDRELAEKAVNQAYPSEGPHFLEKIIQASFEIPLPARDDLNTAFLTELELRCGSPKTQEGIRDLLNLFYDFVSPCLNSPRDLTRLSNSIAVSWPPVAAEVNLADFVALEAIRVFEGALFNAIRANKNRLCGTNERGERNDREKTLEELLGKVSAARKDVAKSVLLRLFPRLENIGYGDGFSERWEAGRRLCSEKHFDTYFRMAVGDDTLSAAELDELVSHAGDFDWIKRTLIDAVATIRRNRKSKIPLILDELNVHGAAIRKEDFQSLISAIFAVADDIDRDGDKEAAFSIGDNNLRIHWLIRKLTFERCSLPERTQIFAAACANAQVGWLVDFASSAWQDYHPREGREVEPPEKCLVELSYLEELRVLTVTALEVAANNNLMLHSKLPYLLFRWRELAQDDGNAVRSWTDQQLANDVSVALFAKAFTRETWSQSLGMVGMGDRVATRHTRASLKGLGDVLDVDRFKSRLDELASAQALDEPYRGYISTFLEALSRKDRDDD